MLSPHPPSTSLPPLCVQVLQLGSNQVTSISSLQLGGLGSLRSLFLQNNDITRIDGLAGLFNLQVEGGNGREGPVPLAGSWGWGAG